MSKLQTVKQKLSDISYLIIDDEIASNPISREDFVDDLGFINTNPQFVASCEEAIDVLKENLEIKFCFLDCKLPKTIKDSINYHPDDSSDYGIQLIDEIIKINHKIPIIVFSAYVDKTELQEQTENNSNIVGYLRKDESPESYRAAFKLAIQHCGISIEEFEPDNSILSLQNTGFNYSGLSLEDSQIIKQKTLTIKQLARVTAESIIKIGQNLVEVKERLPKGQFTSWVESEFPWNIKTVNRFMNVYTRFNNIPLEDLDLLPITALYELSAKSVGDEVIAETIDLAKSEGSVSLAQAREIKQKYAQPTIDSNFANTQSLKKSATHSRPLVDTPVSSSSSPNLLPSAVQSNTPKPKQQIIKVLPQQRLWKIDDHIIYNGEPNSEGFIKLLPRQSALCLNFGSDPHFQFNYQNYHSWLSLYFKYSNLDPKNFLKIIDQTIGSNTVESDSVIVLYIPHEDILDIIHDFYCKAYIVDPDYNKCRNLAKKRINILD